MHKTIFHWVLLVITTSLCLQCTQSRSDIRVSKELLQDYLETFSNEDYPVYHQTMTKEKVSRYIGESFDIQNVLFLLDRPDSLDVYFDDHVIQALSGNLKYYEQVNISERMTEGHPVVNDEDIPEFVTDRTIPPPFNYSGFYNVYFISTPIINENRAFFLMDTYVANNIGITIFFCIRDNRESPWEFYAGGAVHEMSIYRQ